MYLFLRFLLFSIKKKLREMFILIILNFKLKNRNSFNVYQTIINTNVFLKLNRFLKKFVLV